jgi:hypothetical protein
MVVVMQKAATRDELDAVIQRLPLPDPLSQLPCWARLHPWTVPARWQL